MTVGKQRNCGRGIEYEWAGYRSARGAAALLNSRPSRTTLIGLPLTDKPRRKAVLAHVRQQKVWYGYVSCPAMKTRKDQRATEMEWEEALLIARSGESPPHPATYYRRQAARARHVAAEVTTLAMRLRLLNEAVHCDELAAKADRIAEEAASF